MSYDYAYELALSYQILTVWNHLVSHNFHASWIGYAKCFLTFGGFALLVESCHYWNVG